MGLTVLPSSLPTRGGSAAASRACASRLRLDPACIGNSATAAKKPKRPGSFRAGEPLTKRRRVAEDAEVAAAGAMSLDEKNRINRLLISLLPPGSSPNEVIPLPDSVVRVFQEYGTRSRGAEDEEIEIDVHALSDEALRVIKDRVGAYLADREGSVEAKNQSKEAVIEQTAPRSVQTKAEPKSIVMKAAPISKQPRVVLNNIASNAASNSILAKAAPKNIASNAASNSIMLKAVPKSIPLRPAVKNTLLRALPLSLVPPRPSESSESVGDHVEKNTLLRALPFSLVPPRPSESSESVGDHVETAISKGLPRSTPPTASLSLMERAAPRNIASNAARKSFTLNAAPKSIPSRLGQKSIPTRPTTKDTSLRVVPSPPPPPKPSESRETLSEHLETAISLIPPRSTPSTASLSLQAPPTPSGNKKSMKELIADAGEVMKKVVRRREIEKLRAAARLEVEQIVRTVEFNDPYIDYKDVFK